MYVIIEHPECISQYRADEYGNIFKDESSLPLEYYHSTNGFDYVPLLTVKYGLRLYPVDEIVLNAFMPRPIGYNEINHKDSNARNNTIENLEWIKTDESWKSLDCDKYGVKPSYYMISNFGGFSNKKYADKTSVYSNDRGYRCIKTMLIDGSMKSFLLHRLVAHEFVRNPYPNEYNEVNHIDGNKLNNHWKNLEWVSHKMNMDHAYDLGMIYRGKGEELTVSKISDSTVHEICKLFITYYGRSVSVYNHLHKTNSDVTLKMIQHIKHKECWSHISDKYWTTDDLYKLNEIKVRMICDSIVSNNGNVKKVYSELIQKIPDLTTRFIEIIKNKETYSEISDEYFHSGEFMTILSKNEVDEVVITLHDTFLDIEETYRLLHPKMKLLTIAKVRKIRYKYAQKLKEMFK